MHGSAFSHFLKKVSRRECCRCLVCLSQFEANGITGKIKFDENGLRTDIALEVVDLAADGVHRVGRESMFRLTEMFA